MVNNAVIATMTCKAAIFLERRNIQFQSVWLLTNVHNFILSTYFAVVHKMALHTIMT